MVAALGGSFGIAPWPSADVDGVYVRVAIAPVFHEWALREEIP